jgi:hypothetical protein
LSTIIFLTLVAMSDIILKFSLSGCKNIHFAIITKKYKIAGKKLVLYILCVINHPQGYAVNLYITAEKKCRKNCTLNCILQTPAVQTLKTNLYGLKTNRPRQQRIPANGEPAPGNFA